MHAPITSVDEDKEMRQIINEKNINDEEAIGRGDNPGETAEEDERDFAMTPSTFK